MVSRREADRERERDRKLLLIRLMRIKGKK